MVILQSINAAGYRTTVLVFTWFILNASYEITSSLLLLNDFIFSCCFHVILSSVFVPQADVNRAGGGGPNF